MSIIYVTAVITPRPGMAESVRAELAGVVPLVRTEPGCIRYDLHESGGDNPTFLFYEIWESGDALAVHSKTAHLKAMEATIAHMIDPADVNTWNGLDVLPA
ncbi:putative quinol monooxygenase [Desulfoplanes sp.]